jgi:hypothetical protein
VFLWRGDAALVTPFLFVLGSICHCLAQQVLVCYLWPVGQTWVCPMQCWSFLPSPLSLVSLVLCCPFVHLCLFLFFSGGRTSLEQVLLLAFVCVWVRVCGMVWFVVVWWCSGVVVWCVLWMMSMWGCVYVPLLCCEPLRNTKTKNLKQHRKNRRKRTKAKPVSRIGCV